MNAQKTATKITYEVEKFSRGARGEWFGLGARRFADLAAARTYFNDFRTAQSAVLGNGIRIDLRERASRKVVATVGGQMIAPCAVRDLA